MNEWVWDVEVERVLCNVVCEGFDDSVILLSGVVMIGNYEMYKVFMFFKNVWLKWLWEGMLECVVVLKVCSSGLIEFLLFIMLNYFC